MQKKSSPYSLLALCVLTYTTVYMLRVNYSAALPAIQSQLLLTEQHLGLIGGAFFMTYALGQLVNGFISDAVSPFKFVVFALVGTVGLNLLVSCTDSMGGLLLFWCLNGYFQSIFWACLTRILALYFPKEKHSTVALAMSFSMAAGFIITWAGLGRLLQSAAWNRFFAVPALWGLVMLLLWLVVLRKTRSLEIPKSPFSLDGLRHSVRFIREKRLYYVCLICLCMSFVKESISVWGPTIIARIMGVRLNSSTLILCIIPVGNLCGTFLAKCIIDRLRGNELKTLSLLFCAIAAGAGLLYLFKERYLLFTVLLIVEVSAMCMGCNSILLSYIPLSYAKYNLVSTIVGIFDFSSYVGASLSSVLIGSVLTGGHWTDMALLWLAAMVLALGLSAVAKRKTTLY